jgi:hypothetical protein
MGLKGWPTNIAAPPVVENGKERLDLVCGGMGSPLDDGSYLTITAFCDEETGKPRLRFSYSRPVSA